MNREPITVPRAIKYVYSLHDEYMTPEYLVTCLKPYIESFMNSWLISSFSGFTVYCPFDTEDSEYVRFFKRLGAKVIFGDLKTGQNFFDIPIPECDLIVSNPPFSRKKEMFEKLFRNGTPFCMLMNLTAVQYQEIGNMFYEESLRSEPVQFLIPDKKVSFNGATSAFCSAYYCWKFIARTEYIHLEHNNSGKNYVPAYILSKQEDIKK